MDEARQPFEAFKCHATNQIKSDPVLCLHGHCFQREVLEKYFSEHKDDSTRLNDIESDEFSEEIIIKGLPPIIIPDKPMLQS